MAKRLFAHGLLRFVPPRHNRRRHRLWPHGLLRHYGRTHGAGIIAAPFIEAFDHWIAFGLLLVLGGKMIRESLSPADEAEADGSAADKQAAMPSKWLLLITAVATSIDSMIVGVSLAFLEVNIWFTALAIGSATTLMAVIGIKLGGVLDSVIGKRAELFGGIVLIGIGTFILLEHLGLMA